jgi:spectinomycin phosphotransferase
VNVGLLTRHGSSRHGAAVSGLHAWTWSIICPPLDCRSLLRYARLGVNSTRHWQGRPYAVFPYVHGHAQRDDEWRQAAQALKSVHELHAVDLPRTTMDEPDISRLREHLNHPWIRGRSHEVAASISRLDATTNRARAKAVRHVLCHRDFGGDNLLLADGHVVAILDWEQAVMAPREHDLWIAAELANGESFLTEYGARNLDLDHIEYSLLSRALRAMAARVLTRH